MKSTVLVLMSVLQLLTLPLAAAGEPLKTYVSEFSVAGTPDREELKATLQGMLASRLSPDRMQLVGNAAKAELVLAGSYASFGRIFSLDVLIKQTANEKITKVFEQGEGQDDMIPAMGRLARKVDLELARITPAAPPAAALPAPALPAPAAARVAAPPTAMGGAVPAATAAQAYLVKPDSRVSASSISAPLEGAFTSIALGRVLPTGERELFVASQRAIRYLHTGAATKQIAEVVIPIPATILAIDTADLDHDGSAELYVTIMDRETLSSRVYRPTDSGLELLAENQPWFFRGVGADLKTRTIFAQGIDATGQYYGGVAELVKTGNRFETRNARKLPRHGNIFNFTRFRAASGTELVAILDEDGHLVIFTLDGSELWKSSDKYGGSETNFKYQSLAQGRATGGDQYLWTFIEQRMVALPDGTLLVPRNEGTFSIGNNRSYNKHTLHALQWTGTLLKEAWQTRQAPSYLADYAYDPGSGEVIELELVQKPGLFSRGKTAISINRID
jgi:hypothetical protein